jgi:hypothetical protein
MFAWVASRKLTSIANLIGERGEMAKQPLPPIFCPVVRLSVVGYQGSVVRRAFSS